MTRRRRHEIHRKTATGIERCCAGCGNWKPETPDHYRRRNAEPGERAAGFQTYCRACDKLQAKPYRDERRTEVERFRVPPCFLADCWRGVAEDATA